MKQKFAKYFSILSIPVYIVIVFVFCINNGIDKSFKEDGMLGLYMSIALYLLFLYSLYYVHKSGRTRIIPEIVFLFMTLTTSVAIGEISDIVWSMSVVQKGTFVDMNTIMTILKYVGNIILLASIICRVYLFKINTAEYRSDEARLLRQETREKYDREQELKKIDKKYYKAKYDYENAKVSEIGEEELKRRRHIFENAEQEWKETHRRLDWK